MSRVVGFEETANGGSLRVYADRRWVNPIDNVTPTGPGSERDLSWMNTAGTISTSMPASGSSPTIFGQSGDAVEDSRQGCGLHDRVHRRFRHAPVRGSSYRLNLPAGIPAANFWSLTLYEAENGSGSPTGSPFHRWVRATSRGRTRTVAPACTSAPRAPEGKQANWLATIPGRGYFAVLRLYGPTEAAINRTWKPGDIELTESRTE